MIVTFASVFQKYVLNDILRDPDYKVWFEPNECKFTDGDGKFGYFHFFVDALDVKYQVMREVTDFIYVPVDEKTYNGESIKQLISMLTVFEDCKISDFCTRPNGHSGEYN